jgi:hypothetical protein
MADRIACSCVVCPQCGAWVVVQGLEPAVAGKGSVFSAVCPVPECGRKFSFESQDTRVFDILVALFERRYFYRSELALSS